jgi:hypothetical protein
MARVRVRAQAMVMMTMARLSKGMVTLLMQQITPSPTWILSTPMTSTPS